MLLTITFIWLCFMTYLSHQNGKATIELSKRIVEEIIKYFQLGNYNKIHYIIIKLAHPFLFIVLVILVLFIIFLKWNSNKYIFV